MRLIRWASMLAAGALVLGTSAVVAQDTITFAGKEDVSVPIRDGSGATTVVVVNGGDATTIDWSVQLDPAKDGTARTAVVDPPQSPLVARAPNTIRLTIKDVSTTGKLSGVLVGTPTGTGTPITRTLTVANFGGPWSIDPPSVVLLVLFVSLVVLAVRYLTLDEALKGPLTNPKWSYSTTWTASFAGAGALPGDDRRIRGPALGAVPPHQGRVRRPRDPVRRPRGARTRGLLGTQRQARLDRSVPLRHVAVDGGGGRSVDHADGAASMRSARGRATGSSVPSSSWRPSP